MAVMNRLDVESAPPHQTAEVLSGNLEKTEQGAATTMCQTDNTSTHLRHNWQLGGEVRCGRRSAGTGSSCCRVYAAAATTRPHHST